MRKPTSQRWANFHDEIKIGFTCLDHAKEINQNILPAFSKKFLSYLTCRAIFATNRGVLYSNYNQTLWLPQMNSKSSVFPRTLETNPYSIGHTDPLRIEYATFETALWDQKRIKYYKHWNNNRDKWHTLSPTSILLTLLSSFGFNSFNARRVLGLAIFLHPLIIPLPAPTFTCTRGTGGSWEECILPLISTTSGYNFLIAPCSTNQIFDWRCPWPLTPSILKLPNQQQSAFIACNCDFHA